MIIYLFLRISEVLIQLWYFGSCGTLCYWTMIELHYITLSQHMRMGKITVEKENDARRVIIINIVIEQRLDLSLYLYQTTVYLQGTEKPTGCICLDKTVSF